MLCGIAALWGVRLRIRKGGIMITSKRVLLAFCILMFASAAMAQGDASSVFDMSLEELLRLKVSVASRRAEMVREAPAVMTIVTREEIAAFGARNLMDVINHLPGMQIVGHAGFYGNKIQIRAQPNSSQDRHTLILLNGRPVRENINGGNNAYFYLGFPVSAIESIEIIRGPGSVLYGSNAFAAVINIKTRSTVKTTPVSEVSVTYGTYETVDYNAMLVGSTSNQIDYLAAVRISRSEGPKLTWTDSAGRTDSRYYSDDADALYFQIGNGWYNVQAAYHRYSPGDYGPLGALTEAIYIDEVETFFGDIGLVYDMLDNLSTHLNLTLNTFSWTGSNDGINTFRRRYSSNLILEPMVTYEPIDDLNLVVGGTIEYDRFGGRELFQTSRDIYSMYAQMDYQLTDCCKPLIGLQYNKTEGVEGNYSPRVGFVMTPTENWGAKLLYSEAFRRAFAAEGYLDSNFLLGDPSLKPETIKTYEAQINYQNETFRADLTYFYSKQDVIEVDFSKSPLVFINQPGDVRTEGLELTGRFKLGKHWQALGSTVAHSTDNNTPEPFIDPNYPDYMIKAGLMGKFQNVNLAFFNSYLSDGSIWHDESNNLQVNIGLDVSSYLHLPEDRLLVSLFVDNILDEKKFQLPSDVGEDEPIPHSYGRRFYITAKSRW